MAANVTPLCYAAKATARRARQADPYQRGRQGAMRGYGEDVARRAGVSWHQLQHELNDAERDLVRKVARRVRALRECGAAPERIILYLLEILDEMKQAATGRDFPALVAAEAQTDADEDVVQVRALMGGMTAEQKRAWADQLVRNMANERAILAALMADDSYAVAW